MSDAKTSLGTEQSKNKSSSILPANVFIFSPDDPQAAEALLNSHIFTRLAISAHTEPTKLSAALRHAALSETFYMSYGNVVLLFNGAENDVKDDKLDSHHDKFRLVALALKEFDIGLDVAGCVFDAPDILQAGFQLDKLSHRAVMVIDLMSGDDEDDDEDDDDDDDDDNDDH